MPLLAPASYVGAVPTALRDTLKTLEKTATRHLAGEGRETWGEEIRNGPQGMEVMLLGNIECKGLHADTEPQPAKIELKCGTFLFGDKYIWVIDPHNRTPDNIIAAVEVKASEKPELHFMVPPACKSMLSFVYSSDQGLWVSHPYHRLTHPKTPHEYVWANHPPADQITPRSADEPLPEEAKEYIRKLYQSGMYGPMPASAASASAGTEPVAAQ